MIIKIKLEKPRSDKIDLAMDIVGWVALQRAPEKVSMLSCGTEMPAIFVPRLDVERAFPGVIGVGFKAAIDFRVEQVPSHTVVIELLVDGFKRELLRFDPSGLARKKDRWLDIKRQKIAALAEIVSCSRCGHDISIGTSVGSFLCGLCGEIYLHHGTYADMLTKEQREEFRIVETENVSGHPYPIQARGLLDDLSGKNGLALDLGSGNQGYVSPNIICAEIVPYAAVDVLCVGQSLPFRDRAFDLVYSNAVLEHVTDPFKCADEMIRVLKPGGTIFCSVPFLQPEHGYPHHYYNMTMDGLVNLFSGPDISVEECCVPDWGHPLYAGQWFMSSYSAHLPTDLRKIFDSLTINEFLRLRRSSDEPLFSSLSEAGRKELACATYAKIRKNQ